MYFSYGASEPIRKLLRTLDSHTPVHLGAESLPTIIAAGDMGLVAFVPAEDSPHTVSDPSAFGEDPHVALTKGLGTTVALLVFEPSGRDV